MAMCKSQYLSDQQLNWINGSAFASAPGNVYLAAILTAPSDRNGTGISEASGGNYARQPIAAGGWGSITTTGSGLTLGRQRSQTAAVNWAQANSNWGTVVGIAAYDALTSGNFLGYGDLTTSQVIGIGDTLTIPASNLTWQDF